MIFAASSNDPTSKDKIAVLVSVECELWARLRKNTGQRAFFEPSIWSLPQVSRSRSSSTSLAWMVKRVLAQHSSLVAWWIQTFIVMLEQFYLGVQRMIWEESEKIENQNQICGTRLETTKTNLFLQFSAEVCLLVCLFVCCFLARLCVFVCLCQHVSFSLSFRVWFPASYSKLVFFMWALTWKEYETVLGWLPGRFRSAFCCCMLWGLQYFCEVAVSASKPSGKQFWRFSCLFSENHQRYIIRKVFFWKRLFFICAGKFSPKNFVLRD